MNPNSPIKKIPTFNQKKVFRDAKNILEERRFLKAHPDILMREEWLDLTQNGTEIQVPQTRALIRRAIKK